jgi:ribose transport system permease protein
MKRLVGILALVLILYGAVLASDPNAKSLENHRNLGRRLGHWGVLTLGVGILIVSGGIDLSIGSVVGLSAVSMALMLERKIAPGIALALVMFGSGIVGLLHGLLVTKLRLQPFIVTLCGLFIYRGLAQWATMVNWGALQERITSFGRSGADILERASSRNVGIGGRDDLDAWRQLAVGDVGGVPMTFLILAGLAVILGVFLHGSVYGRYLYAIGYNEQAARYAGISTGRYKILAYILCSLLAGFGGVLYLLDGQSAMPTSAGNWYELYAITGAVLGGCSLRGGEGSIPGILLGTAVLPLLRNLCIFAGVPSDLEFTVIGAALLLGTVADELLKRRGKK